MNTHLEGFLASVEDAFGFAIPREDAGTLNTAGNLYDYILTHRYSGTPECLDRMALHRVCRAMMWVLKIPRETIDRKLDLGSVLPRRRFLKWRALEKATGFHLPQLRRPQWVMTTAIFIALVAAIVTPGLLEIGPLQGALFVRILAVFLAGHCLCWLTIPLATEFQTDCITVGQLANGIVARNYPAMVEESQRRMSDAEAWKTVQNLVAEYGGISPRNVTRETDLFEHLVAA
jgi:hypothetical protein